MFRNVRKVHCIVIHLKSFAEGFYFFTKAFTLRLIRLPSIHDLIELVNAKHSSIRFLNSSFVMKASREFSILKCRFCRWENAEKCSLQTTVVYKLMGEWIETISPLIIKAESNERHAVKAFPKDKRQPLSSARWILFIVIRNVEQCVRRGSLYLVCCLKSSIRDKAVLITNNELKGCLTVVSTSLQSEMILRAIWLDIISKTFPSVRHKL